MSRTPVDKPSALPRGEIENLCLLSAIPDEGCGVDELPARLGLSPLLAEPVAEAIGPLVNAGWIQDLDGRVTVTSAGRIWVKERLSEIA